MTNGTSQGLFVVVAIVIFGVFVALSYTVFGNEGLTNDLTELVSDSLVKTSRRVTPKKLVYSSNHEKVRVVGTSEFMQYGTDLSPIFDEHGVGTYRFEFEAKAAKDGLVRIYAQNGSNQKYSFGRTFDVTTEYQKFSIDANVRLSSPEIVRSELAFYGWYGTGVYPAVRNMRIYKVLD